MTRAGRPRLLDRLASPGFSLALFLAATVFCGLGTLVPQGRAPEEYLTAWGRIKGSWIIGLGLDHWFRSPPFASFLVLFLATVLLCLLRRGSAYLTTARRGNGPRAKVRGWSFLVLHLGLLLAFGAGALASATGYIGTANIRVGESEDVFYNWRSARDEKLPFTVRVASARSEYYPARIRLGVREKSGRKIGLWEAVEGVPLALPAVGGTVTPRGFDPEGGRLKIDVRPDGLGEGRTLVITAAGGNAAALGDLELVLVGYRRSLRMVASDIEIWEGGRLAASSRVAVNRPLAYRGYRIYQRDLGTDESGRSYAGFQAVREPGLPMVWLGFIAILLGVAGFAAVRTVLRNAR
jgi:hypothetical protein